MGAFFAKQPNGNFCRVSTSADNFTNRDIKKDELVKFFIENNYNNFQTYLTFNVKEMISMMERELENPPEEGRFVSSFEEALCSLSMSNYETISEVREILKIMGYEKWNTFMTWDYFAGFEIKKVFDTHFNEIKKSVIEYLTPPTDIEENYYYKNLIKKGVVKDISEIRESVSKIETLDDYYNHVKNVLKESEDCIILNMFYAHNDIEELEKLIDRKQINDAINAQFENHSYVNFV